MPRAKLFCFFIIAAAFIVTPTAGLTHPTPRYMLKKRFPVRALPPTPAFLPDFNWEQQGYLKAHNDLRRGVSVMPLVWCPVLTAHAHAWAEQRRGDCDFRHHSNNQYGENIYWQAYKEFDPADVVQWWFNEKKNYDHDNYTCYCQPERAGCECGHYLNVVWSSTRKVGCSGAVYCDNQKGVYVVCEYDPPGLIPGVNPFTGLDL